MQTDDYRTNAAVARMNAGVEHARVCLAKTIDGVFVQDANYFIQSISFEFGLIIAFLTFLSSLAASTSRDNCSRFHRVVAVRAGTDSITIRGAWLSAPQTRNSFIVSGGLDIRFQCSASPR